MAAAKLLLSLIAGLSRQSGLAFGSVDFYSIRLGLAPRHIRRLLRLLEGQGLLIREISTRGRRTQGYRVVVGRVANLRPVVVDPELASSGPKARQGWLFDPAQPALDPLQPGQLVRVGADKSGCEPGQNVLVEADKSGREPGQNVPQQSNRLRMTIPEGEEVQQLQPPSRVERSLPDNGTNGQNAEASPVLSAATPNAPAPAPDFASGAEDADVDRVLNILAPGGASDGLRLVVLNSLADAQAAGVSAAEVAAALPRAGPGRPWDRVGRAAEIVRRERREAQAAAVAAATQVPPPATEPPSARLPALAEAIARLRVREIALRDRPDFKATVVSANADGIVIESPNYTGPSRSTLRTDVVLLRWNFGAADGALLEGRP